MDLLFCFQFNKIQKLPEYVCMHTEVCLAQMKAHILANVYDKGKRH